MSTPEYDPTLHEFMQKSYEHAEQEAASIAEAVDAELDQLLSDRQRKLDDYEVKSTDPEPSELNNFFGHWNKWTEIVDRLDQRKESA